MGVVNQATNVIDRVINLERAVDAIRKLAGLTSAIISGGGLTMLNNAFLKMLGATDNEILYIGPDGAGHQVVRIRDANGNLIFGNVSGGTSGQRVSINPEPTGLPRIDMYDNTTTDHTTLVMFGGNFVLQREKNADRSIDGGKVLFGASTSIFGHQTSTSEAFIAFGTDEAIQLKGWWLDTALSGRSAVVVGFDDAVGSGPVNVSYGYGATMVNRMNPVGTLSASNANQRWAITASSATGFTLGVDAGTGLGFHWWAYRSNN